MESNEQNQGHVNFGPTVSGCAFFGNEYFTKLDLSFICDPSFVKIFENDTKCLKKKKY